jgi:ferritin-like metal-binding protein YciE
MNDLEKLFLSELKDTYDAEQQLVQALPEMEQTAKSDPLKRAFHEHLEQTKTHVNRLERVFEQLGQAPKRRPCPSVQGLVLEEEGMFDILGHNSESDAVLVTAGHKAEHYEIASYGTLCEWAKELGYDSALGLLSQTLSEEKQTDEKLDQLGESAQVSEKLFLVGLQEMYDAEHLLASALAELQKYAVSKVLKLAFWYHQKQTEKHSKRLEKVFEEIGSPPNRRPCKGVEGIIDEAQTLVMEFLNNSALDAALIAAAQKAEHYEITTYRTLCSWAKKLGKKRVMSLLEENLSDEEQTDKALTLVADFSRNPTATRQDSHKKSDEEAMLAKAITHGQ